MSKQNRIRWVVRLSLTAVGCGALAVAILLLEHRRPIIELERAGASVVCDTDGRPRTISFCSTQAGDAHLQLMSRLTSVSSINLGRSRVTSHGLRLLTNLPHLHTLDLSETVQGEGVPDAIADFPALRTLQVRRCPWVTDEALQKLSQLDTLECLMTIDIPITDRGLAHLSNCRHLKQLGIDSCSRITDDGVRRLARNSQLESVSVNGCIHVSDAGIRDLAAVPSMRFLSACGIPMQRAALKEIVNTRPNLNLSLDRFEFPELQPLVDAGARIGLDDAYEVCWVAIDESRHDPRGGSPYSLALYPETESPISEFASQPVRQSATLLDALRVVPELPALYLNGIAISESGWQAIGRLTQLRRLVLEDVPISDEDLHALTECRSLEALWLRRVPVTGEGIAALRELPRLRELSLLSDCISQAGIDAATSLDNLETLAIGDVSLVSTAAQIAGMSKLSSLAMVRATMTVDDMKLLTTAPRLQRIELLRANLHGEALSPLADMPGLKSLSLARCEFDRDALARLRDRRPDLVIFGAPGTAHQPRAAFLPERRPLLGGIPLVVPSAPSAVH